VSEYLLTGITISIAASLVVGEWAGAAQGLHGVHSGRTLRTNLVCENVWVIIVLGAEAMQVYFAFYDAGTKDFFLICLIFALTLPSIGWIYSQSSAVAATVAQRLGGPLD
jgi:hypothetical protein